MIQDFWKVKGYSKALQARRRYLAQANAIKVKLEPRRRHPRRERRPPEKP